MQTYFNDETRQRTGVAPVEQMIRKCVHCGFCNVTCPTYQLTGDELDGPRGRIYQVKNALEEGCANATLEHHLDRCLTCRNCETTCPAGVRYSWIADLGRELVAEQTSRPLWQRLKIFLLGNLLPYRNRFRLLLGIGRLVRPLLPATFRSRVPLVRSAPTDKAGDRKGGHSDKPQRRVILLEGCVQDALVPTIDVALKRLFDSQGIELQSVAGQGCCGAIDHHLAPGSAALDRMRNNIDAWWPLIQQGVEAIVVSATGCGQMVSEYGRLLVDDPKYAERALKVSSLLRDPVELVDAELIKCRGTKTDPKLAGKIALQIPCTAQHGERGHVGALVEDLLQEAGFELVPVVDGPTCCGSAGTYSILQPELSEQLRQNKLQNLTQAAAQMIVTANIGCQVHLQRDNAVPVRHWIELLDEYR